MTYKKVSQGREHELTIHRIMIVATLHGSWKTVKIYPISPKSERSAQNDLC